MSHCYNQDWLELPRGVQSFAQLQLILTTQRLRAFLHRCALQARWRNLVRKQGRALRRFWRHCFQVYGTPDLIIVTALAEGVIGADDLLIDEDDL